MITTYILRLTRNGERNFSPYTVKPVFNGHSEVAAIKRWPFYRGWNTVVLFGTCTPGCYTEDDLLVQ